MFRGSIYNNLIYHEGFCYIHFPLIFMTESRLCSQSYADASVEFIKICGLENKIYHKLIDYSVLEILYEDIQKLHNKGLEFFQDKDFLKKLIDKLKVVYKELPRKCLEFENCIRNGEKYDFKTFKKIYDSLVYLLAVNNFGYLPETFLGTYLNKYGNKDLDFLSKNVFSHIKYYNEAKSIFKKRKITNEQIQNFFWNAAFLENKAADASIYEDIDYLSEQFKRKLDYDDLIPEKFSYPDIKLQISSENIEKLHYVVLWAALLQTNTEFRHYWQLRFLRNVRLYFDYDKTVISGRFLKDYKNDGNKIK